MEQILTFNRARELFNYDAETGILSQRVARKRSKVGDPAGSISGPGYLMLMIDRRMYYVHRIIWLYVTGSWPKFQIDHINRDKTDNRWANLRDVTNQINCNNVTRQIPLSGVPGVGWSSHANKWRVLIHENGKPTHKGYFSSKEIAAEVARSHLENRFKLETQNA